jgi:hypothetical protein
VFAQLGCAHFDAQCFGHVRAGNGAAVVVGEDDERAVLPPGLENAFAAAVEVVAVDEGELRFGGGHGVAGLCMDEPYIEAIRLWRTKLVCS